MRLRGKYVGEQDGASTLVVACFRGEIPGVSHYLIRWYSHEMRRADYISMIKQGGRKKGWKEMKRGKRATILHAGEDVTALRVMFSSLFTPGPSWSLLGQGQRNGGGLRPLFWPFFLPPFFLTSTFLSICLKVGGERLRKNEKRAKC